MVETRKESLISQIYDKYNLGKKSKKQKEKQLIADKTNLTIKEDKMARKGKLLVDEAILKFKADDKVKIPVGKKGNFKTGIFVSYDKNGRHGKLKLDSTGKIIRRKSELFVTAEEVKSEAQGGEE